MNLLDLAVKIGVKDEASSKIGGITEGAIARASAMGQAMYDATKFVAGKAVEMVSSFTQGAIEGYGEFEQMRDGIKKLYGDAAETVISNSEKAFREAGMSQNQYLQASTTLAASLIRSLGDDMDAAAERNAMAMKAIADNADTFGTSVEDVTNVYSALSRGMYQTLDNLRLGYAGTKTGMEQLIADANTYAEEIGETGDMTIDSFADIVRAIDLIQQKQGIAGTTANEALTTVQGSLRMLRNGWSDFVAAVGSGDIERIQETMDEVKQAIFGIWDEDMGAMSGGVIRNVLPIVQNVGAALVEAIPQLAESVSYAFLEMIGTALGLDVGYDQPTGELAARIIDALVLKFQELGPTLAESAVSMMDNLATGFAEAAPTIMQNISTVIETVIKQLPTLVSGFASSGAQIVTAIVSGIVQNAPSLVQTLVETLTGAGSKAASSFSEAFGTIGDMVSGIMERLPDSFEVLQGVIDVALMPALDNLGEAFSNIMDSLEPWMPAIENVATLFGGTFIDVLAAVINIFSTLVNAISAVIDWLYDFGTDLEEAGQIGADFVDSLKEAWDRLPEDLAAAFNAAIDAVTQWASDMYSSAQQAMSDFLDAVTSGGSDITTWFSGLPGEILGALGSLGSLLYGAGSSIISGLWSGMKAAWSSVTSWVSGLGSWIASHKGPKEYDLGLLVPNGRWIMQGLNKGLRSEFPQIAKTIGDVSDLMNVTADLSSTRASEAAYPYEQQRVVKYETNYYVNGVNYLPDSRIAQGIQILVDEIEFEGRA